MADLAGRILGAGHEEAGVEAARPAGRRDGAGDQVEAVERRREALVEEALPVLAVVLLRCAALERLAEDQAGLLEGLAHRGDTQRLGPLERGGFQEARLDVAVERRGDRHMGVGLVDAPSREDVAVGHEGRLGSAAESRNRRDRARTGTPRPSTGGSNIR